MACPVLFLHFHFLPCFLPCTVTHADGRACPSILATNRLLGVLTP